MFEYKLIVEELWFVLFMRDVRLFKLILLDVKKEEFIEKIVFFQLFVYFIFLGFILSKMGDVIMVLI